MATFLQHLYSASLRSHHIYAHVSTRSLRQSHLVPYRGWNALQPAWAKAGRCRGSRVWRKDLWCVDTAGIAACRIRLQRPEPKQALQVDINAPARPYRSAFIAQGVLHDQTECYVRVL